VVLPLALMGVVLFVGAKIDGSLSGITNKALVQQLATAKINESKSVIARMGAAHMIFGLGPGNGLSRIGLSTVPSYGNVPPILLGGERSELARHELAGYNAAVISSTASIFSSWLGLYTELGIMGMASYLALGGFAWAGLGKSTPGHKTLGRVFLAFGAILGLIFLWIEEPAFGIFMGVLIGSFYGDRDWAGSASEETETAEPAAAVA